MLREEEQLNSSFSKMSVPIFVLGFVLMTEVETPTFATKKAVVSEEPVYSQEAPTDALTRLGTYEGQLDELEEELQALIAELDKEKEMISFEQYQHYQTTLDTLIQQLNTVSQDMEAEPSVLTKNFKDLLRVQEKMYQLDVK